MTLSKLDLYDRDGVRALDQQAIAVHQIPGWTLMQRAGQAAWKLLRQSWPNAKKILIVAGQGNNGGDGFVLASLANAAGCNTTIVIIGDTTQLIGDAKVAYEQARASKIPIQSELKIDQYDVIVDALFGTGLTRPLADKNLRAIEWINQSSIPVLSLDIPSGLDSNTGVPQGGAVRALKTITFVGEKQGLFTGKARSYCGEIFFDDLQVPGEVYQAIEPSAEKINFEICRCYLSPRDPVAHKRDFGHVVIIGGDTGMPGAPRLAAEAALRVGAGLVTVATKPEHVVSIVNSCAELMSVPVNTPEDLDLLLQQATVIAIGPGLGQNSWGQGCLQKVLSVEKPIVIDADGLNILSHSQWHRTAPWIITPHPGEAGRLLGQNTYQVEQDRFLALDKLIQQYKATVVLKGAGTLVGACGKKPKVCIGGNPGMATAGMGDVLTGTIAGLLAQNVNETQAAELGVSLHAAAGDCLALEGARGMIASDIYLQYRRLLK